MADDSFDQDPPKEGMQPDDTPELRELYAFDKDMDTQLGEKQDKAWGLKDITG